MHIKNPRPATAAQKPTVKSAKLEPASPNAPAKKRSFAQWCKKHLWAIVLITASLVIAGIFIVAINSVQHDGGLPFFAAKKKPTKFYSPLTGLEVADEAATKQPVTAVMIENSPDARPQSGLSRAGIVYEAVAEGGITRFLAVYQGAKPGLIGPVRSLRLYYLSWGAQYQASIAHVGGSPNALDTVRSGSYRDIDQFFNGGSYWRASDRRAPHNVYTSGEKLDALNASKGFKESSFTGFKRGDGKPAETPNATTIQLNFSGATYNTAYAYDKATNTYKRSLAGAPHADREGGQIAPRVVVALEAPLERRVGPDGYEDTVTIGSGKATVFQNGTATAVTWKKDSLTAPLKLFDENGKDITLGRGQTWIGVFTPGRGSVTWR